ncbi:MAG: RNA polymerase sigma factor SigJ [Deltaproteobacteria bacterium]|nr:RNA polymerase sigma factor SigJ [Deltaproteobacteria bacterium]
MADPSAIDAFEAHRRELVGLAYRLTGSLADAEDVVQDAFVRFERAAGVVEHPRAWLHRVVTRLCVDLGRSAPRRREVYTGAWLPELLVEPAPSFADAAVELADEVTVALLLALERLSPVERAAFVLREAFDYDYGEIGALLDKSDAACRQLVTRARGHLRDERPRYDVAPEVCERVVSGLFAAVAAGDPDALGRALADDVVLVSDGGGKVRAALNPILGADKVARFLLGTARKSPPTARTRLVPARVGGLPGFVHVEGDAVVSVFALDLDGERVRTIYIHRNPDKLRHVRLPHA